MLTCWDNITVRERISSIAWEASTSWQMINHLAYSVFSASAWTWISTFIPQTSFVWRTVRIKYAFWSASFIGISNKIRQTNTSSGGILFSALSVCPARRRNTRCGSFNNCHLLYNNALDKWVSFKSCQTYTVRSMTYYSTLGIDATWSWTRVFAFLVYTGQIIGTFAVTDTFWFTVWRRSYKFWKTRTRWRFTDNFTLGIRSTGRWIAWVYKLYRNFF